MKTEKYLSSSICCSVKPPLHTIKSPSDRRRRVDGFHRHECKIAFLDNKWEVASAWAKTYRRRPGRWPQGTSKQLCCSLPLIKGNFILTLTSGLQAQHVECRGVKKESYSNYPLNNNTWLEFSIDKHGTWQCMRSSDMYKQSWVEVSHLNVLYIRLLLAPEHFAEIAVCY